MSYAINDQGPALDLSKALADNWTTLQETVDDRNEYRILAQVQRDEAYNTWAEDPSNESPLATLYTDFTLYVEC